MKHKFLGLVSAICLVAFAVGFAKAAPVMVSSGSVSVSASIVGVATLTITPKLISDNSTTDQLRLGPLSSATTDNWTTAGIVAPAYVQVAYTDNSVWEMKIYTDNFPSTTPSTTTWAFQYGALKGLTPGNKMPLAWQAEELIAAPPVGNPSLPASGWLYVKDRKDVDDPATSGQDESWAAAGGYTNIAYGSALFANFVDPNLGIPSPPNPILGNDFNVYVQALPFANADTYSTSLGFDLINQ